MLFKNVIFSCQRPLASSVAYQALRLIGIAFASDICTVNNAAEGNGSEVMQKDESLFAVYPFGNNDRTPLHRSYLSESSIQAISSLLPSKVYAKLQYLSQAHVPIDNHSASDTFINSSFMGFLPSVIMSAEDDDEEI